LFVFAKIRCSTPPFTAVQTLVGRLLDVHLWIFLEDLLCHVTVDPLNPIIWFLPEGTVEGNFYMYFLPLVQWGFPPSNWACVHKKESGWNLHELCALLKLDLCLVLTPSMESVTLDFLQIKFDHLSY
jgi:hypothetical protein